MPYYDRCPNCDKEIYAELHDYFMSGSTDYGTYFDFDCPHCKQALAIEVESTPIFLVTKKENGYGTKSQNTT